ncbi:MAG: hypothetical protein JXA15_04405 [Spirochaetales bacterium]|nr:hypothetical protein [Spirochaetales bacterium]
MPRPEDLKRFQNDIRKLGRETELLASWGEQPFDVPRPESPADAAIGDLAELLDLSGTDAEADTGGADSEGIEAAAPESLPDASQEDIDFTSFLDDLSLDAPPSPGKETYASADEPLPSTSDLPDESEGGIPADLLSGLGEDSALTGDDSGSDAALPSVDDEFALPPEMEEMAELAPDEDLSAEVPASETFDDASFTEAAAESDAATDESFDAPSFDLPSFDEDFSIPSEPGSPVDEPTVAPGPDAEYPADLGAPVAFPADEFALPDLDAGGNDAETFDQGFTNPEPDEGSTEAPLEESPPDGFDSGFSIPDFDAPFAAEPEPSPLAEENADHEGFEIGFEEAPAPKPSEPSLDDFDSFTSKLGIGADASTPDDLGGFDLDTSAADLTPAGESQEFGGDLTPSDTFNLESGWGEDFRIPGFEEPKTEARPQAARPAGPSPKPSEHKGDEVREVSLSDAQVDRLQDTLLSYPLNLRLAIEDALANDRGNEAQRSALVWALVDGMSPKKAAELAGAALHKRIEVPKAFEKRTGAAFEAEKGSLAWILVNRVMPVILGVAAALAVAGGLAWLGWKFVYTPIAASAAYRDGYESIRVDRYVDAERSFSRGDALWRMKKWYYLYAEAYVERDQYAKAELKYEALLKAWPGEKRAALDYAELERSVLLNYGKAAEILETNVLSRNRVDSDALLMLGDVYLEWGDETRGDWTVAADPPLPPPDQAAQGSASWLYEQARLRYARLLGRRGWKDPYLERMLRYFIRVEKAESRDMLSEIDPLGADFLDGRMKISALSLAELGGYYLDRNDLDGARRALLLADELDPTIPDIHYHMARYFNQSGDSGQEFLALRKLVPALENLALLRTYRLGMLIDALGWLGLHHLAEGETVMAREHFERAITLYEDALSGRRLGFDGRFGVNYARLADVLYTEAGDDEASIALYERAERAGYVTNETRYRRAAALYRLERLEEALIQAHRASLDVDETPALLLLTGNILARREDWFAAQAAFDRLSARLRFELERLPVLLPQERPAQGELVELLMRATNNLGVAWWRLAARAGDASLRGKAMASFTESMRLFDALERDQATMIKPAVKNLAFLNMDFVLRPQRGIDLEIYPEAPRELGP